ncbi:penicillin-binding protein 1C [Caulobacter ginsengisoli]|uniref:peptidoglycan glycosyltransferase n=1 Tax=Caulobacter ginsengisoli TaxID=400775 RepID=A0ABU0IS84_9CAUL|nr:penicillin-binding protein 1C [Caulobacter ginsengisoli]MDQ0464876.1 penicillin-binding protein 1C [Caulobacter ginsengisoli]
MTSSPERRIVLTLIAILAIETALVALDAVFPPDLGRAHRSSPVALDRRGAWLRALPVENGRWRIRADLERTDPSFLRRVVRTEDSRFYDHPGVDPVAVVRAVGSAIAHGRVTSGASTLSMQTARLLEPHPRSLFGKLGEMVRAIQIEARYSKHDILALYLTLAPYGGNLEGVRAASLSYFGHEPESLTIGEQALLIALPQAPEGRRPDRRPAAARTARDIVLARMARAGLITSQEAAEAQTERLPLRQPFPSMAWHVAGQLARAAPDRQASVVSTLDAGLQARLEPLAAAYAKAQGAEATASILVVQINGRAVRAAVGSGGLDRPGGWIDMTTALRSPGSSLKPFIYAFAFDDGVAAPDTRIQDVATRFSDYQPENFDRVFHGQVTAREALSYSLNVPAVAMMERIGPASFLARLESADVRLVTPKKGLTDPGLAIALGGEGITLRDLALLYAALGDGGIAKPLAWTEEDAASRRRWPGTRLVRAESAKMVLDILRDAPGPKGRVPAALTRGGPGLAFKTGTSYGFRDAVAAGVVGDYVIICWTGRADGGARGGLTGREAALPMLFDVADMLAAPSSNAPQVRPRGAPQALQKLERPDAGPRMIFPPDKATIQVDGFGPKSRGLALSARGEALTWYVEGAPLDRDPVSGQVIWRPAAAGFYRLKVIDGAGREAVARVRVK